MLAEGLALLVAFAPAAVPRRAAPARHPVVLRLTPENSDRAKRGLLPRKIAPLARSIRSKRSLYRPAGPAWVPEPSGPGPEVAAAEVDADSSGTPVAYPEFAAAIHGVEVRWMVIRHVVR